MRSVLSAAATAVWALALLGCTKAPDAILAHFAAFDRAYITALALTGPQPTAGAAGQPPRAPADPRRLAARRAMARLQNAWRQFGNAWAGLRPEDPQWAADFEAVGRQITQAGQLLGLDRPGDAHRALEPVRTIFRDLRRRHKMKYYLDLLTDFHEPMEAIVAVLPAELSDPIPAAGLEHLDRTLELARDRWASVRKASPSDKVFGLDPDARVQVRLHADGESAALAHLADVLDARASPLEIRRAVSSLRPPFAGLYLLFGDFSGLGDVAIGP
jgi:hypothetical protein